MEKLYYISASRSNERLRETYTGKFITLEGEAYYEMASAPRGKRVARKLTSLTGNQRITIYS